MLADMLDRQPSGFTESDKGNIHRWWNFTSSRMHEVAGTGDRLDFGKPVFSWSLCCSKWYDNGKPRCEARGPGFGCFWPVKRPGNTIVEQAYMVAVPDVQNKQVGIRFGANDAWTCGDIPKGYAFQGSRIETKGRGLRLVEHAIGGAHGIQRSGMEPGRMGVCASISEMVFAWQDLHAQSKLHQSPAYRLATILSIPSSDAARLKFEPLLNGVISTTNTDHSGNQAMALVTALVDEVRAVYA